MWIEVEAKLAVSDVKKARESIKKIASLAKKETKVDEYYSLSEANTYQKKSLRIRKKKDSVEVNFKKWMNYKQHVNAKKEVEFSVSDINGFYELLRDFGFKRWLKKIKFTELYETSDGIHIELNKVKHLGWFIEIEILCLPREVKQARKRVVELVKELGYEEKDVIKEGYTRALFEKGAIS